MNHSHPVSRREFIAGASCFGAAVALARWIPLPALAEPLAQDSRIAAQPLVDKGFASVRKVGNGVYATISDFSKGTQTICNGGFVIGRDSALLIEGFGSPGGAAFQMDALRMVSQVPVRAALDTHYHFDHSMGNAFYGAQNIPLWAHAKTASRIVESYTPLQGMDRAAALGPYEKAVQNAKNDTMRQHAQSDLSAVTGVYSITNATVISLPNHPLDPAQLPKPIDLGGVTAVFEYYPGHSGTDVIVRVPEQNIVFTGDLFFNGWYPVTFDLSATISGWRATLAKFAAFDKDTIFVPGHGQVTGQQGIALARGVFDDLAEHAQKMFKAGVPVEEAVDRYSVPEKFKDFPIFAWGFTIGPAITKLYAEWNQQK
ncbi:MAG TPA: MBL fold metallo-hydrolase [Candidatus Limnocylindria bacterium]|nr:MBL fold metallo-hydrolase [Candidatus Limnocylindria bacterium]